MGTTVTQKGQVTIPKRVRDHLGIRAGTTVEFELASDGRVTLTTPGRRPKSAIARQRGILKGGLSTDEIMALTRGED